MAAGKRLRSRLVAAALGTASALGALGALELGARLLFRAQGAPYDRAELHRRLEQDLDALASLAGPAAGAPAPRGEDAAGSFPMLHPFFGAEESPDTGGALRFLAEEHGPEVYTVVVLGGTTAASWAQAEGAALARLLGGDPRLSGRDVRVLSSAHPAHKQPQQVGRLTWLLSFGYRPDAVVNLDGFGEVVLSCENAAAGTHPLYPSPPVWGAVLRDRGELGDEGLEQLLALRALQRAAARLGERALRLHLTASSLYGRWLDGRLDALDARRDELRSAYLARDGTRPADKGAERQRCGADFDPDEEAVVGLAATSWFEGSLLLHEMCAARGIRYVHVLEPTALDDGSQPPSERERAPAAGPVGWRRSVELGYPRLRERGRELAARGVAFLDASGSVAGVTPGVGAEGRGVLTGLVAEAFLAGLPADAAGD